MRELTEACAERLKAHKSLVVVAMVTIAAALLEVTVSPMVPSGLSSWLSLAVITAAAVGTWYGLTRIVANIHVPHEVPPVIRQLDKVLEGSEYGRLVVHYQPTVSLSSAKPTGVEALVRWDHPERGLLSPDAFIGLAEQHGRMRTLTRVMAREALAGAGRMWSDGHPLKVALNMSAHNLIEQDLPDFLAAEAACWGMPTDKVVLELTETSAMADPEESLRIMNKMRDLGFGIALDDFGTGYSSLYQLHRLPINTVKLDRTFVSPMLNDSDAMTLVSAMTSMCHRLGLTTVAEGIEDVETAKALRTLGVDSGQGYLYARPMAETSLRDWLTTWQPDNRAVEAAATGTKDIRSAWALDMLDEMPVVLLVDDDQDFREISRRVLEAGGYAVMECQDSREATRVLESDRKIDAVLIDVQLRGGPIGADLARCARTLRPQAHVVLMSGQYNSVPGMDDLPFLLKPFRRQELLKVLAPVASDAPASPPAALMSA